MKVLILIVLTAFSLNSFAAGTIRTLPVYLSLEKGMFWGADVNRDGRLSIEEAETVYNLSNPEVFNKYDKNGDGYILIHEFYDYYRLRGPDE